MPESSNNNLPVLLTVEETARYVGRQHRIRKEDIEEYLRRQETRGVAKNGGKTPR